MLIAIGVFIALDLLAVGLLFVPPIQQKVVTLVTDKLSEKWHSRITIGHIYLSPTLRLTADDFVIRDHKDNPMISADKLSSRLKSLKLKPVKVGLYPIDSEGLKVVLRKYKGDESVNIAIWTQNFKKEKKSPEPFVMKADALRLKKAYFALIDDNKRLPRHGREMDYGFFEIKDIDWEMKDFALCGSDISALIEKMSFRQYTGFVLNNLSCDFRINSTGVTMKDATMVTPSSRIFMDFAFSYGNWKDLGDFLNKANFDVTMRASTLNLKEVGFFAPKIAGMDNELVMTCRLSGPVNNMHIHHFDARYADSTHLAGEILMRDITDFTNADIKLDLADNKIDFGELQKFLLPGGKTLPLPHLLSNLGTAKASITYDGIISQGFAATAELKTIAGNVDAILETKRHEQDAGIDYDATVKTRGVNIGRFVPKASMLGPAVITAKAKGSVGDLSNFAKTLTADFYAQAARLYVKGYPIRSLMLDGYYGHNKLNADFTIKDPNCAMQADVDFTFSKLKNDYEISASIDQFNATQMFSHLQTIDSTKAKGFDKFIRYVQMHPELAVSIGSAGCMLSGKNLEDMAGNIYIDQIRFQQDGKTLNSDRIRLAMIPQSDRRVLRLASDLVNVAITTDLELNKIPGALSDLAYHYAGNLLPERKLETSSEQDNVKSKNSPAPQEETDHFLDLDVDAYHIAPILEMFVPKVSIADNSHINVKTNQTHTRDALEISIPNIEIGTKVDINNLVATGNTTAQGKLEVSASVGSLLLGEKGNFAFDDIRLESNIGENQLDYRLFWQNPESISDHKSLLAGEVEFPVPGRITTHITESEIYMKDAPVSFNKDHLITLDNGVVYCDNVHAFAIDREVSINGHIGSENDSLVAIIQNFDIDIANQFVKSDKMQLDGDLSANIQIRTYNGTRIVVGSSIIDGFSFNDESFGTLFASAIVPSGGSILFRGGLVDEEQFPQDATIFNYGFREFQDQQGINTRLNGKYDTEKKELRVTADMETFPLGFMEPFLSSFCHKFEGDASGAITFVLKKDSLYFDGKAHIREAQMGIAPLNTIYTITDQEMYFDKNGFTFDNMVLADRYENHATLSGYIHHQNFKNFDLNLNISTPKIFILDTKQSSDSPFYGQGFISGNVAIYGNTEKLYFAGHDIATEKGTVFCLPISFADKVYDSDVITFKKAETEEAQESELPPPPGMEMDFDFTFNVTPAAVIRLDLNLSAFGGAIRTSGEGTMNFTYNSKSGINLFGDVRLNGGSFMMTFMDILNKKFELQPGGSVTFDGPLDNININVAAVYSTSASLSDLFSAENTNIRRMPVKASLLFNGNLSDPAAIDFAFNLPNATSDFKTMFYSAIDTSNIQNKTEQFFSLVMLGKFVSATPTSISDFNIENTSIGLLTNTLSNIISNQLKHVDLSLNYQNASADKAAEYSVGASTSLFNDRTIIEGYFGYKDDKASDISSQFIGDFSIEQKLNELGTWRLKVFNVTNQDDLRNANRNNPYAQGVAIIYKQDFNNRKDILASFKRTNTRTKRKKKQGTSANEPVDEL